MHQPAHLGQKQNVWWRPGGPSPFSFDPAQPRGPQIFAAVWQSAIIFGGPLLGLVTINSYPFLIEDRTLCIAGLLSIAFWFCANFVVPQLNDFPPGMPQSAKQATTGSASIPARARPATAIAATSAGSSNTIPDHCCWLRA